MSTTHTLPVNGRYSLTRTRRQTFTYFLWHPAVIVTVIVAVIATTAGLIFANSATKPAPQASITAAATSPTHSPDKTSPMLVPPALSSPASSTNQPRASPTHSTSPTSTPTLPAAPVVIPVTLTVGATDPVPLTVKPGTTTGALLAERKLTLGVDDTVTPALKAALTAKTAVVITRIGYADSTTSQTLPQPADRTVDDPNIDAGKSDVVQQGHPGRQETSLRTKTVNGKAQPAVQTGKRTIVPPAATITHVGTRAVRLPDPPPIQPAPPVDPPQLQPVAPPAQQQPVQPTPVQAPPVRQPPDPPPVQPAPLVQPPVQPTPPPVQPTPVQAPPVRQPPDPPPVQPAPLVQPPVQPTPPPVQQPVQPPPPPPTDNFSISCSTAATVQVTVSGSGPVSLQMSPGGSFSGTGGVSGSAQVPAGGSVSVTWSGSSFRWNGVGGSCHQ